MRIEVAYSPEPNLIRVRHARTTLGTRLLQLRRIHLVVVAGTVAAETVELVAKRSGRGLHRVFACPRCAEPRTVLFATPGRQLRCAACSAYRTRQQKQGSGAAWKAEGLDLEDRLLRALMKGNHNRERILRLRALARELVEGDRDRAAAAMLSASAALELT